MVTVTENIYNPDHAVQANVFDVFILFHFYTFSSDSRVDRVRYRYDAFNHSSALQRIPFELGYMSRLELGPLILVFLNS